MRPAGHKRGDRDRFRRDSGLSEAHRRSLNACNARYRPATSRSARTRWRFGVSSRCGVSGACGRRTRLVSLGCLCVEYGRGSVGLSSPWGRVSKSTLDKPPSRWRGPVTRAHRPPITAPVRQRYGRSCSSTGESCTRSRRGTGRTPQVRDTPNFPASAGDIGSDEGRRSGGEVVNDEAGRWAPHDRVGSFIAGAQQRPGRGHAVVVGVVAAGLSIRCLRRCRSVAV
jgi:hypothetical protein